MSIMCAWRAVLHVLHSKALNCTVLLKLKVTENLPKPLLFYRNFKASFREVKGNTLLKFVEHGSSGKCERIQSLKYA